MPKYEIVMPTVGSDVVINYPTTGGTLALEGGGGGGGIAGTNYIYVAANGTDTENATELQAAYDAAKTMSPSSTNIITIIAAPGKYNFGSATFTMDTQYINLVSLDGNRSVIFNAALNVSNRIAGSISVTADMVLVRGVDAEFKKFGVAGNLHSANFQLCRGGQDSFGEQYTTIAGRFTDCVSTGPYSFGGYGNTVSGIFENCTSAEGSFGGYNGVANGTFINCVAGSNSFGGFNGTASGYFKNCTSSSNNCFGGAAGGSVASGIFIDCSSGNYSFGSNGTASGQFSNCVGGQESFGATGSYPGALTGRLFNCRLTTGVFQTPTSGGKIILCLDGSDNIINATA